MAIRGKRAILGEHTFLTSIKCISRLIVLAPVRQNAAVFNTILSNVSNIYYMDRTAWTEQSPEPVRHNNCKSPTFQSTC